MRSLIYSRNNPYNLMLLLCMLGSLIMFMVISVIYITRIQMGTSVHFRMPFAFWMSTIMILASSLSLREANRAFKTEQFEQYKNWLGFTLILGVIFVMSQLLGWMYLTQIGIGLNNSPSGAFVYLLSGLHVAHIVIGLVALALLFVDSLRNTAYVDGYIQSLNPVKQARLKLFTRYWHFVDLLWIYLFVLFVFG